MQVLNKKIAFFSEGGFTGQLDRTHPNLRMPEVWYTSLNATHYPITSLHTIPDNQFDIGIIIIPKNLQHLLQYDIVGNMRRVCSKIAFQQEGASWIFQDYEVETQVWFYSLMLAMDFGLCHTERDRKYYESILNIPVFVNPTLMLDEPFKHLSRKAQTEKVIIGGNLVRYYGGFNSYLVAREFDCPLWAPSMGRMKQSEKILDDLNHLPWMLWNEWMIELSSMKYAVHLNPNTIAGSFNNNCAYWGIPCIGNIDCDTQRINFPELSLESDDISGAMQLAKRLKADKDFYEHCSEYAKISYKKNFAEETFLSNWKQLLASIK
jgi:hypothetical protein